LLLCYISLETYPSAEITDYPFGLNSVQNPMGVKKRNGIRFSDLTSEELKQHFKPSQSVKNASTLWTL